MLPFLPPHLLQALNVKKITDEEAKFLKLIDDYSRANIHHTNCPSQAEIFIITNRCEEKIKNVLESLVSKGCLGKLNRNSRNFFVTERGKWHVQCLPIEGFSLDPLRGKLSLHEFCLKGQFTDKEESTICLITQFCYFFSLKKEKVPTITNMHKQFLFSKECIRRGIKTVIKEKPYYIRIVKNQKIGDQYEITVEGIAYVLALDESRLIPQLIEERKKLQSQNLLGSQIPFIPLYRMQSKNSKSFPSIPFKPDYSMQSHVAPDSTKARFSVGRTGRSILN